MRIFGYHDPDSRPPYDFFASGGDRGSGPFRWEKFRVDENSNGPFCALLRMAGAEFLSRALKDRIISFRETITVLTHWGSGGFFVLGTRDGRCPSCGFDGCIAVIDGVAAVASGLVAAPSVRRPRGADFGEFHAPGSGQIRNFGPAEAATLAFLASGREPCMNLDGPLAAIIADPKLPGIHGQRDFFGQKRLHVCSDSGRTGFSDHPVFAAMMILGRINPDPGGIDLILSYNFSPGRATAISGVTSLPGGGAVSALPAGKTVLRFSPSFRYFPSASDRISTGPGDTGAAPDEVLDLLGSEIATVVSELTEAARCSQCGKGPARALLLSGGIDSAAVAVSWPGGPAKVRAYGLDFRPAGFSESPRFTLVATTLSMSLRTHRVGPGHVGWLPAVFSAMGWPAGDASFLAMAAAGTLAASEGVGLLFTGDGGDEIAGGYERMGILGNCASPVECSERSGGGPETEPSCRRSETVAQYLRTLELFTVESRRGLYRREFLDFLSGRPDDLGFAQSVWKNCSPFASTTTDLACLVDIATLLPGNNCPKTEVMLGLSGVMGVAPLMSSRVSSLLASLPPEMRNSGLRAKAVLRDLVARALPAYISEGRKKMLTVPVGEWYKGVLRSWLEGLASGPLAAENLVFKPGTMTTLLTEHLSTGETRRLRAFLALEVFIRVHFKGYPGVGGMFSGFPEFSNVGATIGRPS